MAEGLTPAELTLLGLVVEKPRHGYELEEVITERGMREWTEIGFSSIYYLLGKLRDRGLITEVASHDGVRRGRQRKVYESTERGRVTCTEAAEFAITNLRPLFPPVLVGLANQPMIAPDRLRAALDSRTSAIAEKIAEVQQTAARHAHAPHFVQAIFDYSLCQLRAEHAWLCDYRAELARSSAQGGDE